MEEITSEILMVAASDDINPIPTFLSLPAEIRSYVYSLIIPDTYLLVNLCPGNAVYGPRHGKTIAAGLLRQHLELVNVVRQNGLHLLLVCKTIRQEVLPMLQAATVRFHCEKCYAYFLRNMTQSVCIGLRWLRKVEIELCIDVMRNMAMTNPVDALIKSYAEDAMKRLQKITWTYYGRLDLMGKEKWSLAVVKPTQGSNDGEKPCRRHPTFLMLHSAVERGRFWLVSGVLGVRAG